MVSLLIGTKGSGKTKKLIEEINGALARSKGNVVVVEKSEALEFNVNYRARLVTADEFGIAGFDELYAFLAGLCAGNHDITDVLLDATLRIGSREPSELAAFLKRISKLSADCETDFVFTISMDEEDVPAEVFGYCKKI